MSPLVALDVRGAANINKDTDTTSYMRRGAIFAVSTDHITLSHLDFATSTGYALDQDNAGNTELNAATGRTLNLSIASTPYLIIQNNGNVGIGSGTSYVTFVESSNKMGINNASPTYDLDITGTFRATGELHGTRASFKFGWDEAVFTTSRYLKVWKTKAYSATFGDVMPYSGSIVAVCCSVNNSIAVASSYCTVQVRKAGVNVFASDQVDLSTTGDHTEYKIQARGTDTFSAGDVLSTFVYVSGGPTIDDIAGYYIVTFDD